MLKNRNWLPLYRFTIAGLHILQVLVLVLYYMINRQWRTIFKWFSTEIEPWQRFVYILGIRRQECSTKIQSLKLPKYDPSKTVHLHHAHASWWRMESNPVQLVRFHEESVRNQLHWNLTSAGKIAVNVVSARLIGYLPCIRM